MTSTDFLPDLIKWENAIPWPYRDSATAGNVTVGIGCLLATPDVAVALPFMISAAGGSVPASEQDIRADFARVLTLPPGLHARAYRAATSVELLQPAIEDLAVTLLEGKVLPALRRMIPGFDDVPDPAQSALVDMLWTLGEGRDPAPGRKGTGLRKFTTLLGCARAGQWKATDELLGCDVECHRLGTREERNVWTAEMFAKAGALSEPTV